MTDTAARRDIQIDPRGYRFGAAITLALSLFAVLFGNTNEGIILMFVLAVLFLPGAIIGPQATVQAWIFKKFIRPRFGKPKFTESFRPTRFAQQVGLVFSIAAIVLGVWGPTWGYFLFAGFVLAASFLNAVFGFCLGCEIYLAVKRLSSRTASTA